MTFKLKIIKTRNRMQKGRYILNAQCGTILVNKLKFGYPKQEITAF